MAEAAMLNESTEKLEHRADGCFREGKSYYTDRRQLSFVVDNTCASTFRCERDVWISNESFEIYDREILRGEIQTIRGVDDNIS